jgi:hypothetical protein
MTQPSGLDAIGNKKKKAMRKNLEMGNTKGVG